MGKEWWRKASVFAVVLLSSPFQGGGPLFFFFFSFTHDFWRSAEEKQLYAQVAQATGLVELSRSAAPQLLFLGCQKKCLGLMSVLHFQVYTPGPEPKSRLGDVTVRVAYCLRKTSNLTIL